jgi:hypothetical protein
MAIRIPAHLTALALLLCLLGCSRGWTPPHHPTLHVAPASPVPPPPTTLDASKGLVAYARDGVAYVREVLGGAAAERAVAPFPGKPGPKTVFCPTFLPDGRLLVIEPKAGLWVIDPVSGEAGHIVSSLDVAALGVDPATGEPVIGLGVTDGPAADEWWYAARVRGWSETAPIGVGGSLWVSGDLHSPEHRLRCSASIRMITEPRFPNDAVRGYRVLWRPFEGAPAQYEQLGWCYSGYEDDPWFTHDSVGVDIGRTAEDDHDQTKTAIYVVTAKDGDSAHKSGLARMTRSTTQTRKWIIQPNKTSLSGVAVSEPLGVAALESTSEDQSHHVMLYRLKDESLLGQVDGSDPDIWPR